MKRDVRALGERELAFEPKWQIDNIAKKGRRSRFQFSATKSKRGVDDLHPRFPPVIGPSYTYFSVFWRWPPESPPRRDGNPHEDTMQTTIIEVGQHLEKQAKIGRPITYTDVVRKFPDLPPLTAAWRREGRDGDEQAAFAVAAWLEGQTRMAHLGTTFIRR